MRIAALDPLIVDWLYLSSIVISVTAAAIDVESIVFSGPTCIVLGLIVAAFGIRRRSFTLSLLGISTLPISLAIFLLIFFNDWSPAEAQRPITLILFAYELAVAPISIFAMFRGRRYTPIKAPLRLQFHVRSLLVLTLLVAIDMAAIRAALNLGADVLAAIGCGLAAAIFVAATTVTTLALRIRTHDSFDIPFQLEGSIPP